MKCIVYHFQLSESIFLSRESDLFVDIVYKLSWIRKAFERFFTKGYPVGINETFWLFVLNGLIPVDFSHSVVYFNGVVVYNWKDVMAWGEVSESSWGQYYRSVERVITHGQTTNYL